MIPGKKTKLKFQIADVILCILIFLSLVLMVWGINIYRMTIIPLKYLFTVGAFGTIIAFGIIVFTHNPPYKMIYTFLTSIVIGGGIFYFSFLFLNDSFKETEVVIEDFQIIKTGNLARGRKRRCGSPYVVINFNDVEKELIFYCEYEKTIKSFSKVKLEYSKGLFGFEVINTKQLLR